MTTEHPLTAFRHRQQPQWTIRQLAELIGVATNTVWRWENGRLPERGEWPKIVRATGIPPDEIVRFAHASDTATADLTVADQGRINEPDRLAEELKPGK